MWWYKSLILLHVLAGLAVWTWVIRNPRPRAGRRARGETSIGQRQRVVDGMGAGSITAVALAAVVTGLVDARGVALVLGTLVGSAQLLLALVFKQRLDGDPLILLGTNGPARDGSEHQRPRLRRAIFTLPTAYDARLSTSESGAVKQPLPQVSLAIDD